MPTRVSRSYLSFSLSLSLFLLSIYSPRLASPRSTSSLATAEVYVRYPISFSNRRITTVIKLTVLKSDSRDVDERVLADVRMRHTRLPDERSRNESPARDPRDVRSKFLQRLICRGTKAGSPLVPKELLVVNRV